jgi:hypothetical protein
MLRFGTNYYPPNRWGNDTEEEESRLLLHESMHDLNRRAFIADCRCGDNTPDQPPHDYFLFDPYDWISVFWRASAVCKCLADIRKKARAAKRALPPIEALQQAIRGLSPVLVARAILSVEQL